jgi:hypothetical protein
MRERDYEIFPEADAKRAECSCPHYYAITVTRSRVYIMHDALFLPEEIFQSLHNLHVDYAKAWVTKKSMRPNPREVWCIPTTDDYVGFSVKRRHARSWIALMRQIVRYAYNRWREERENKDREGVTLH